METPGYTSLTRQSGLLREMQTIANNIANISTTGYRREGLTFSEYVHALEPGEASLSMARAHTRHIDPTQGGLDPTGGPFDLAIEGDGYFMVETAEGPLLTRAGSFTPNEAGELAAPDGARLLDVGGAPIFVPTDAGAVSVASDGTLSYDGQPVSQIGLYIPADPSTLSRRSETRFAVEGEIIAAEDSVMMQGFLESSNVDPILEVARMIEVQHAYQIGQTFLEQEDERIRSMIQTLTQ